MNRHRAEQWADFFVGVLLVLIIVTIGFVAGAFDHDDTSTPAPHTEELVRISGPQLNRLIDATTFAARCGGQVEIDHNTTQPHNIEILVAGCDQ